jgi:hypothetical protein
METGFESNWREMVVVRGLEEVRERERESARW